MFIRKTKIFITGLIFLLFCSAGGATVSIYLDGIKVRGVKDVVVSLDGVYNVGVEVMLTLNFSKNYNSQYIPLI